MNVLVHVVYLAKQKLMRMCVVKYSICSALKVTRHVCKLVPRDIYIFSSYEISIINVCVNFV